MATQPVWAALLARTAGNRVGARAWWGIGIATAGAVLLAGADVSLSPAALVGDLLATAGAVLAAGYVTVGAAVRVRLSTTAYTAVCYSTCALLLLAGCLVSGEPLTGYDGGTWLLLVALTCGAQFLGHSLFNVVLSSTGPTVVSLAVLFEAPGAALLAAVFLGQVPAATALPGLAVLLAGVAVVIRSGARVRAAA